MTFSFVDGALSYGHAGGADPVLHDPMQRAIGIGLHALGSERRHRRLHLVRERHAGVLAVKPVAHNAVMREAVLARGDAFGVVRQRVLVLLAADKKPASIGQ